MKQFYRDFYGKKLPVSCAVEALEAWLHEHLSITEDLNPEVVVNSKHGLQFVPAYDSSIHPQGWVPIETLFHRI